MLFRSDGYMGMPHCFQMMRWSWQANQSMKDWGDFCRNVTKRKYLRQDAARWTDKHGNVTEVRLSDLGYGLDDLKVDRLLKQQKERRIMLEKQLRELDD